VAGAIRASSESREEIRKKELAIPGAGGSIRQVEVTVLPACDRAGAVETIACLFREVAQKEES